MRTNGDANAIYYPSVPFQGEGTNLCINRGFFKTENIELKLALRNEFSIIKNADGKHSFTEKGKIETKDINYKKNEINWNIK